MKIAYMLKNKKLVSFLLTEDDRIPQGYLVEDDIESFLKRYNINLENNAFYLENNLNIFKKNKINLIKQTCTANNPVSILVDLANGKQATITFNGGDSSAGAILAGVNLKKKLGEATIKLWDINNKTYSIIDGTQYDNIVTLQEAEEISATIADKFLNDMYKRQNLLDQIDNAATIEEVEAIKWN